MKIKISFICLLFLLFSSFLASANAFDSLGIRVVDGKKYILHRVEPKETLYALGRRYHVSVAEIRETNPKEKGGYKIDQIGRELLIPYHGKYYESSTKSGSSRKGKAKQHVVNAGQTVYSISVLYDVSQRNIMDWNGLESTILRIGQKLWVSDPESSPSVNTPVKEKEGRTNDLESKAKIVHVVDLGETIYSISKRYDVKQSEIISLNGLKDNNIVVGQKLIVKAAEEKVETLSSASGKPNPPKFHKAKKGESYRRVASKYGLKESNLRKWNGFKEPFVGGEVIKIMAPDNDEPEAIASTTNKSKGDDNSRVYTVRSNETLYSLAEKYNVEVEELRKWNGLDTYKLSRGQKLYIQNPDALTTDTNVDQTTALANREQESTSPTLSENPQKQDTKAYFTIEEEDMPKIEKVKEKGVAEVIEGSEGTEKYLALHRTAKIGTIMQVRNDLNDQIVFVRVLGKLPDTGVDEKVVIKISKKAFEKLGGVDYKFPVEISYLPLKD